MPQDSSYSGDPQVMSDMRSDHEPLGQNNMALNLVKATVLRSQIIIGALISGVLTMSLVLLMVSQGPRQDSDTSLIAGIGGMLWVMSLSAFSLLPILMERSLAVTAETATALGSWLEQAEYGRFRNAPDDPAIDQHLQPLLARWMQSVIVRAAALEGGAMVCLILWLTSSQWWLLVLVGINLGLMLIMFPTPGRLFRWLENRVEQSR